MSVVYREIFLSKYPLTADPIHEKKLCLKCMRHYITIKTYHHFMNCNDDYTRKYSDKDLIIIDMYKISNSINLITYRVIPYMCWIDVYSIINLGHNNFKVEQNDPLVILKTTE